ncbi:SHOCT domain-containing protein [Hymenobacter sp. YC55]|uniref:SHOCT domain-containing protein n=1 Tax=Hymenobacter sp. YC55 TaxID=3034019 RepID=UPI0023F7A592|nr:SHOCT domain-containing protein [Hymenobacter sp. YC55]MDF7810911.1 SHOCT domain-containing protein [Hymenobacter sp. YC55]
MFAILLLIGNVGAAELLIIMGLLLTLILAAIWRLLRPAKQTVVVQQPSASVSVANELLKLQQLLQQGVLTPAEFEEQKRRLLR